MQVAKTVSFENINAEPVIAGIITENSYEKWAAAAKQARFIGYNKNESSQVNSERFIFSLIDPLLARFKAAHHRVSIDSYKKIRSELLKRMLSVKPTPDRVLTVGIKKIFGNEINPGMLEHGKLSLSGREAISFWIKQIYKEII